MSNRWKIVIAGNVLVILAALASVQWHWTFLNFIDTPVAQSLLLTLLIMCAFKVWDRDPKLARKFVVLVCIWAVLDILVAVRHRQLTSLPEHTRQFRQHN